MNLKCGFALKAYANRPMLVELRKTDPNNLIDHKHPFEINSENNFQHSCSSDYAEYVYKDWF